MNYRANVNPPGLAMARLVVEHRRRDRARRIHGTQLEGLYILEDGEFKPAGWGAWRA
ncbi:hypothetical protein OJF2_79220 (plasmid) [Aquisphaera giovannonii]|uniref:Uncharacterized protein n=1 Tax=Aquisphaera giovannonii TaxID=406548 RepID=A0A5B9WFJ4_9BACT|nr:hypothetical protein OJF2_79220 [Aquisphaera giovannonii]